MPSASDADRCINTLHDLDLLGNRLRVQVRQKRRRRDDEGQYGTAFPADYSTFGLSSVADQQKSDETNASGLSVSTASPSHTTKSTPDRLAHTPNSTPDRPLLACTRCSSLGKHRCSRCKVPYCGRKCQSTDWPQHKMVCQISPSHVTPDNKHTPSTHHPSSPSVKALAPAMAKKVVSANPASPPHIITPSTALSIPAGLEEDEEEEEASKWTFSGFEDILSQFSEMLGHTDMVNGREPLMSIKDSDSDLSSTAGSSSMTPEHVPTGKVTSSMSTVAAASHSASRHNSVSEDSVVIQKDIPAVHRTPLNNHIAVNTMMPDIGVTAPPSPLMSSPSTATTVAPGSDVKPVFKAVCDVAPPSPCYQQSTQHAQVAVASGVSTDNTESENSSSGNETAGTQGANPVIDVIGLCASGTTSFWARVADKLGDAAYLDLNKYLSKYEVESLTAIPTDRQLLRMVCVVRTSDGHYRRAKLMTPPVAQARVSAQLIDEGRMEMVNCQHVYDLPDALSTHKVQPLAFNIGLHGVRPVGYNRGEGGMAVMEELTKGRRLSAVVLNRSPDRTIAYALVTDENGASINDAIVETPYADAFSAPSRPYSGLGRGARQLYYQLPGSQPAGPRPVSCNANSFGSLPSARGRPSPASSAIPGFSLARLQGPHADAPTLMTLPRGFQCIQLPQGDSNVKISSICAGSAEIFVQVTMKDQMDRLSRLNEDMNTLHRRTRNSCYVPMTDEVCLARYSQDGLFYRVRVLQEEASSHFLVRFVDYGNLTTVHLSDLRHMRQDFSVLPFQAVHCALAGIGPAGGAETWSAKARNLLQEPESLVAHLVRAATSADEPNLIELFNRAPPCNLLLNKQLVVSGAAMLLSNAVQIGERARSGTSTPINTSAAGSALPRLDHPDKLQLPIQVGQTYQVRIVFIRHVSMFYLSLVDDISCQKFDDLSVKIQESCANQPDPLHTIQVGDLCCAVFSCDGLYYRAKVQRKLTNDKLMVIFVDFGSVTVVHKHDIRHIDTDLLNLPFQAVPAAFYGIRKRVPGVWSSDAIRRFAELADNKVLTCKVSGRQELQNGTLAVLVLLYDDTDAANRIDIREAMVESNYATYVSTPSAELQSFPVMDDASAVDQPSVSPSPQGPISSSGPAKATDISLVTGAHMPDCNIEVEHKSFNDTECLSQLTTIACEQIASVVKTPAPQASLRSTLSSAAGTSDSPLVYAVSDLTLASLPEDISFRVLVSEVDDPSSIWLQPYPNDMHKFIELSDQLGKHCATVQVSSSFSPAAGDVCCALFEGDGQYYRVFIEDVLSNKRYRVTYIDFGTSATINASLIYPAIPAILELRIQAVQCQLGVQLPSPLQAWPERVQPILDACVNETFEAVRPVSEFSGLPAIDLEDTSTGKSVCESIRQVVNKEIRHEPPTRPASTSAIPAASIPVHQPSVSTGRPASCAASQSNQSPVTVADIPKATLSPSQPVECIVTQFKSPSDFWLTRADSILGLKELLDEMSSLPPASVAYQPCVGEICAALFSEDENWYRARVNCVVSDTVEVTFVDFGNSETTTISALQPLPADLLKLPLQAIHCCMDNCEPANGVEWSAESKSVACSIVSDTTLSCISHGVNDAGHCRVVVYTADVDEEDVASQLVSRRLAAVPAPPPAVTLPSGTAAEPVTPAVAASVTGITPAAMTTGDVLWSSLPHGDGDIDVIVADVDSPACFHVQYADSDAIKILNSLMNLMNDAYSGMTSSDRTSSQCMTSLCCQHAVCAAQFSQDGGWYRATVLECSDESDQVKVRFTDFGNTDLVSKSSLRPLQADMLQLPMQAIECTLADVKPVDSTWSKKANEVFCSHLGEVGSSRVMVQHSSQSQAISTSSQRSSAYPIRVTSTLEGRSINDILVAENYAVLASPAQPSAPLYTLDDLSAVQPSAEDGYFEGLVSDTESPCRFYLQLAKAAVAGQLQELGKSLTSYCKSSPPVIVADLAVDQLCIALFSADRCWYRVVVCEIFDKSALVRFVDYGNTERVSEANLRHFDSQFLSLPRQALMCKLHNLESSQADGKWSPAAGKLMEKFSQAALCVRLYGEESGVLDVDLYDTSGDVDVSIGDELVSAGFGKYPPSPVEPSGSCAPQVVGSSQSDSQHFRLCDLSAVQPSANDGYFEGLFSDAESPSHFHLQLAKTAVAGQLQELGKSLTSYCKSSPPVIVADLAVDQLCIALFSADRCWYRVVVCEIFDKSALVRFVDYGNTERVSEANLRHFDSQFLSLPRQALMCKLHNLESSQADGKWSPAAGKLMEKFSQAALCVRLYGEESGVLDVDLYDTSGDVDVSIGDELVSAGFGKYPPSPVEPSGSCAPQVVGSSQSGSQHFRLCDLSAVQPSANDGYFEGLFSDAESPSHFHLQLAKTAVAGQLQELGKSLTSYCKSSPPVIVADLAVDQLCIALFSADRCWYRVVVCEIFDKSALVRFVDYGNTERVSEANLRHFDSQFLSLPRQALMCKLHSLESSQADGKWSPAAGKLMEKFSQAALCVRLYGEESGVLDVDLYDTSGDVDVSIGDELVSAGYARQIPSTVAVDTECALGTSAKRHSSVFPVFQLPTSGQFSVVVVHSRSPSSFSVQSGAGDDIRNSAALLADLNLAMEKSATATADSAFCPTPGTLCCARFSEDQCWYRAIVDSISADSRLVDVTFIDFGNKELAMSVSETRSLPEQFKHLPGQAVTCALHGIGPAPRGSKQWSSDAVGLMCTLTPMELKLTAQRRGMDGNVLLVDLVDGYVRHVYVDHVNALCCD